MDMELDMLILCWTSNRVICNSLATSKMRIMTRVWLYANAWDFSFFIIGMWMSYGCVIWHALDLTYSLNSDLQCFWNIKSEKSKRISFMHKISCFWWCKSITNRTSQGSQQSALWVPYGRGIWCAEACYSDLQHFCIMKIRSARRMRIVAWLLLERLGAVWLWKYD